MSLNKIILSTEGKAFKNPKCTRMKRAENMKNEGPNHLYFVL